MKNFRKSLVLLALAGLATPAWADAEEAREVVPAWRGKIEVKREATSRGTPEETTKTAIKIDTFLDGPVALLRLDMPFPDEKTDFAGDPLNPAPGDVKVRLGFRAVKSGAYAFPSFVEITFPTASPESLGSGKYQASAAIRMLGPLAFAFLEPAIHESRFELQLQHVQSFAGDAARKDVRHTKAEITAYDEWREKLSFKLKLKPVVDWQKDARTGATLEYETGWFFAAGWKAWLMFGARVWGANDIASTYNTRLELGLSRTY